MHPMFMELFIQTDADDLAPRGHRRRRVHRSRRARRAMIVSARRPRSYQRWRAITSDKPDELLWDVP